MVNIANKPDAATLELWRAAEVGERLADVRARMDVAEALAPFELRKHLSANRTQGVPNMIALVRETAQRLAA